MLAGCVVSPAYHRPATPVPPSFRDVPATTTEDAASFADLPWWETFHDPALETLIRTALERNYNVRIAAEQITAAREQLGITLANRQPHVTAVGGYSGGKSMQAQRDTHVFAVNADVSYQLDLFGGLRSATEASRAQFLATEEARRTVVMTLVSDLATDYYQLLSLDLQLQIARDTVQSQNESLRITGLRVAGGTATKVDALQARQVLDAAVSRIPDLERQAGRLEDAISLLLGNYPEATPRGLALTDQYLAPDLPPGLTSALLERRPDIRQAETNLMYYNAEIGVARAALYPQVAITGALGPTAILTSLLNSRSAVWTWGSSLTDSVFNRKMLQSKVKVAESVQRQALLSYSQTIQRAFGEVADALIDYRQYRELRLRQEQALATLQESVRLATMRYQGGVTTYLEVLDTQRSLFAQQLALVQTRGYEYQSVVKLYKALGGGWQQ